MPVRSLPEALLLLCMQSAGADKGKCGRGFKGMQKAHLAFFFLKCLSFWSRKSRLKQVFSFLILFFFFLAVSVLLQDLLHRALDAVSTG